MEVRKVWLLILLMMILLASRSVYSQESDDTFTLEECIKIALEKNLQIHSAMQGVIGSDFRRKQALTNFFPQWTMQYSVTGYNSPAPVGFTAMGGTSRDVHNFNTSVTQSLFAGGSILANYRLEKLGVDISKTDVETIKRDIILDVKEGYFNILRAEKFLTVAQQQVKQFEAQLEVTKAFFDVGIVPKNDVLQAEVKLANARQALIKAENDLALAKSSFNILLRRDINATLKIKDILEYKPFQIGFEESLKEALKERPEIKNAELKIEQANENVKIAKGSFFPTITLSGNYIRASDEPSLMGDIRSERWTVQALATFTIWDWGKRAYKVGEAKVKVTQAQDSKTQLVENIILEVKNAYLNMLVAEKNISVAEKAIEQAEENLRMNEERYKYQVATATDVLDAVTLLTQARVNYYSALSDFNIAKAKLERAMGRQFQ